MMLLTLVSGCTENKGPADIPPDLKDLPSFSGKWQIQGLETELPGMKSNLPIFIDMENKKATFGNDTYDLEMDSIGLRIKKEDRENAVGYFLFAEIKSHTWVGTWEDRVIRLTRHNSP